MALLRSESEAQWQQGAKVLADWASMDPQFATAGAVAPAPTLTLTLSLSLTLTPTLILTLTTDH